MFVNTYISVHFRYCLNCSAGAVLFCDWLKRFATWTLGLLMVEMEKIPTLATCERSSRRDDTYAGRIGHVRIRTRGIHKISKLSLIILSGKCKTPGRNKNWKLT